MPVLWRPEYTILYDVATKDGYLLQSSDQRILVSGGVVIVISVKLYVIKSVAAKRVAATFVAARTLPENSRFPTSFELFN
jgi:hypothetical protein